MRWDAEKNIIIGYDSIWGKCRIADIWDEVDDNANSSLIVSAPELLDALKELVAKCEERGFHPTALIPAQKAINKAEGR